MSNFEETTAHQDVEEMSVSIKNKLNELGNGFLPKTMVSRKPHWNDKEISFSQKKSGIKDKAYCK